MNLFQAIKSGFRNFINIKGRACRSELWYWILFWFLCGVAVGAIAKFLEIYSYEFASRYIQMAFDYCLLVIIIPTITVTVRRLHDIGRTGWWILFINFVPLIGPILGIYWFVQKGEDGENQYGEDPLAAPL